MTIDQLKYFLAVAENLNFSATADELCISQSSLSKHIKTLEDELEVQLFIRSTRSVKLTEAGKRLQFHVEKIMDEYEEMLACVKQYSGLHQRSISIAAIPVLSSYGITDMITRFSKSNPHVSVKIQEADAQYVLRALESREADVGMLRTRYLKEDWLKVIPIIDDDMVMLTHRDHRFARRGTIDLREASNEQFYLLGESTFMYQPCVDECMKAGFFPRVTNSEMRLSTIHAFIRQGAGVSLLMRQTANNLSDPEVTIVEIKERPVFTLAMVTHNDPLPPVCLDFVNHAIAYFNYHNLV